MYKVSVFVGFAHFFDDQASVRSLGLKNKPLVAYKITLAIHMSITLISVELILMNSGKVRLICMSEIAALMCIWQANLILSLVCFTVCFHVMIHIKFGSFL